MPYVTVEMMEGRDLARKKVLIQKVTDAVSDALSVEKEQVVVFIKEIKRENFGRGGVMKFMPPEPKK